MGNGMCFGKGPPPNVLSRSIFLSRSLWCTFYPFMFGWNFAFLSFLCLGFVCIPFKLIQIFLSDCSGVCRAAARQGWLYNRLENVLEGGVGSLGSLRWRSAARCSMGDEVYLQNYSSRPRDGERRVWCTSAPSLPAASMARWGYTGYMAFLREVDKLGVSGLEVDLSRVYNFTRLA